MFYPYYKSLQEQTQNMNNGNFGLWYNKFIPITDYDHKKSPCKASDNKGDPDNAVKFYADHYSKLNKTDIHRTLSKKHLDHAGFCDGLSLKYEKVIFKAKLKTPLITGIGETHPHEVSMVFDHSMGIPYIPASGIKGIVRFAHTLGLLADIPPEKIQTDKDGKEYFDDEKDWTNIPQLFGTQNKRGAVFFLDAYPEKVPNLHIDIMNPHYGDYYGDDTNKTPPADYLNPIPIKFLTVAKDTVFVFRALVDRELIELTEKVKTAFKKALTEEGVGAKTAVGYGLFENLQEEESESVFEFIKKEKERKAQEAKEAIAQAEAERLASMTEDEKMIEEIANLQKDTSQISALFQKCIAGDFASRVYMKLKEKLKNLDEWKPYGSKKKKAKMKDRNANIEAKMDA